MAYISAAGDHSEHPEMSKYGNPTSRKPTSSFADTSRLAHRQPIPALSMNE